MVYESGFTTRRTYSSRPVVTSYAVSRPTKTPIDWEKCPFVPRPSLIMEPVTAFGQRHSEREDWKASILNPINRSAIKPSYQVLNQPIKQYVSARDKNRERILSMVQQHVDTVERGGSACTGPTSRDSLDAVLPRMHRAASESVHIKREIYRNPKSGAWVTRYVF